MSEIIKHKPLPTFSIGVDCGTTTGIAVFSVADNLLFGIKSTDFFGAIDYLGGFKPNIAIVYVEIPPAFVYARNRQMQGAVRDKFSINAGGVRRESQLLAEGLRKRGLHVVEVPPIKQNKWTQEEFERHLKTDIKTNQHIRDAARIAWSYAGKKF